VADITTAIGQPAVNEWTIPGHIPAVRPSRAVGSPHNTIGRRIAHWVTDTVTAAACAVATRPRRRPTQRQYHRRERFVEDAAMSREMFRL
jgi:hypothetical protein